MRTPINRQPVVVAGIGLHPFGRFPDKSTADMVKDAVQSVLDDSHLRYKDVDVAYYTHVYYQGVSPGERYLMPFGLTGIPILNIENACSSGTTGIWQAYWSIAAGLFDCALIVGAERVPKGPVAITEEGDPQKFIGDDHMMAQYAMKMRKYINQHQATVESIAEVSVKAHSNASKNQFAQFNKEFSIEDVLDSRMIADPLTLFQCCPTSEGSAATILMSEDKFKQIAKGSKPIYIRSAELATSQFINNTIKKQDQTEFAAEKAYLSAGIKPDEIDLVQVHDAATIGEILQLELLGLIPKGEGWKATKEGRTSLSGDLPVNTDGGLQAMGHPFGASGIRMLHEIVTQIRGEAGERQITKANTGLIQCSGAAGISTVSIVSNN